MSKIKVPFVNLAAAYRNDALAITAAIDEIGNSGQYILGTKVKNFEKEFAEFIGTKYAIGVANGSDALFLIMKALGIGPGDEVITQPNSFIASAWTIVATGATPVFCEVDETLGLDPEHLLKLITPRTKAVMPVHLTGNPTKIDAIQEVLTGTGIEVIEDAAQAVGAKFNGKRVGSFGIAAMFSLHPLKNLGVLGDGGVITTDSEEVYAKIIKLRIAQPVFQTTNFNSSFAAADGIKYLRLYGTGGANVVVVGNFNVTPQTANITFPANGTWYDFMNPGQTETISGNYAKTLAPGEYHIYTTVNYN